MFNFYRPSVAMNFYLTPLSLINRPGVAGAVPQTALSITDSTHCLSQTTCHMSGVKCRTSDTRCQVFKCIFF